VLQDDGTFVIRGDANLGDCDTVLDLEMDEEETSSISRRTGTNIQYLPVLVEASKLGCQKVRDRQI
jgi:Mg2+/Co2+ transporter CorB